MIVWISLLAKRTLPRTLIQSTEEDVGEEQVCARGEQRIHCRSLFRRTEWCVRRRRVEERRSASRVEAREEEMS
jgi:hypothetical protein